jgi:hypothetical protein
MKKFFFVLPALLWPFPSLLFGADVRTGPADIYVILDASSAVRDYREEALEWVCGYVVDRLLIEGDTLTVVAAGDKASVVLSETINADKKEAVKQTLRGTGNGGGAADYSGAAADYPGALREAADRQAARRGRTAYTFLISGTAGPSAASGSLVRYSRVEDFSGWRVLTVGLGIDQAIRDAAAAYMR